MNMKKLVIAIVAIGLIGSVLGVGDFLINYPTGTTLFNFSSDGNVTWSGYTDCVMKTDGDGKMACGADNVTLLKDLVTTAPITGGTDDILVGADADITLGVDVLKDIVAHAPLLVNGTTNIDNIVIGVDSDIILNISACDDTYILKYNSTEGAWECEEDEGGSGIDDIVEDTTPQLGGNLDIQAHAIDSGAGTTNMTIDTNNNLIITLV